MSNILKCILLFTTLLSTIRARNIFEDSDEKLALNPEWRAIKDQTFAYFEHSNGLLHRILYVRLATGFWFANIWLGQNPANNKYPYKIYLAGNYRDRSKMTFNYDNGDSIYCGGVKRTGRVTITCGPEHRLVKASYTGTPCLYLGTFETPLACDAPLPSEVITKLNLEVSQLQYSLSQAKSRSKDLEADKTRLTTILATISGHQTNKSVAIEIQQLLTEEDQLKAKIQDLTDQIYNATQTTLRMSQRNNVLTSENDKLIMKSDETVVQIRDLEAEKSKLSEDLETVSIAHNDSTLAVTALEQLFSAATDDANRMQDAQTALIVLLVLGFAAFLITVGVLLRKSRQKRVRMRAGEPEAASTGESM
eukprot:775427_1